MHIKHIHIIFFYNVILLFGIAFILRINTVLISLQIVDLLTIFTHFLDVVLCYIYYPGFIQIF